MASNKSLKAIVNEYVAPYKFVDEQVFSLTDDVYFIIQMRISVQDVNGLRPFKNMTKFFRNIAKRVYGDDAIRNSDPKNNPPKDMRKFCKIVMTLWNQGPECFPKVTPAGLKGVDQELWDTYKRMKHELTQ